MGILAWIVIGLIAGWLATRSWAGAAAGCCTISPSAWSAPSSAG